MESCGLMREFAFWYTARWGGAGGGWGTHKVSMLERHGEKVVVFASEDFARDSAQLGDNQCKVLPNWITAGFGKPL